MNALDKFALVSGACFALLVPLVNGVAIGQNLMVFPGAKSANTPTGAVVDGLALSVINSPLPHEWPGYRWLSLELRNEGTTVQYVKGYNSLTSIEVVTSDMRGNAIPSKPYPGIDLDPGPLDSHGVPIAPGSSFFMRVPIDAMVRFPHRGSYVVRIKTTRVVNVATVQPINIKSNALTIQV